MNARTGALCDYYTKCPGSDGQPELLFAKNTSNDLLPTRINTDK